MFIMPIRFFGTVTAKDIALVCGRSFYITFSGSFLVRDIKTFAGL